MRIFKLLIVLLLVVTAFYSCTPKYDKQYSWAYPVGGDWMVNAYVGPGLVGGPYEIKSYNSSFGRDSIWFDDYNGNFKNFKVKTFVDMSSKTFSTIGSPNAIKGTSITSIKISNGKIIGTDSITMDVVFSNSPTIYRLAGHREQSYEEYTQQ
jgi:hypothetical protein